MWINDVYPTLQRHIAPTRHTIQALQGQAALPPAALSDVLNLRDTLGYLT